MTAEYWGMSHRADDRARPLADRHYNRQKIGATGFVPPGRCKVFLTPHEDALWITSWPFAQYTRHAWAGAWVNSCFRNESPHLSSCMIRDAVALTRWCYAQDPKWNCDLEPDRGMITFVDARKTRHKRDPGRCYRKAGFTHAGFTKGGLWAFQMLVPSMPAPREPRTGAEVVEI